MCVSHTTITGVCACSLCHSFTVVWGHSWLMAVNGTSVKASECGQLKSRATKKDGWLLLVQSGGLLFNTSHFLFLGNASSWKWSLTGHFTSRAAAQLTEDTHTHTHTHTKDMQTLSNACNFSVGTAHKMSSALYFSHNKIHSTELNIRLVCEGGGRAPGRKKKS